MHGRHVTLNLAPCRALRKVSCVEILYRLTHSLCLHPQGLSQELRLQDSIRRRGPLDRDQAPHPLGSVLSDQVLAPRPTAWTLVPTSLDPQPMPSLAFWTSL